MSVAEISEAMAYRPASESTAPAQQWLTSHRLTQGFVIENRDVAPRDGAYFESANPAIGQPLIRVAQACAVELAAAGNMKRTWIMNRPPRDWRDPLQGQSCEFLRQATQVKNVWVPMGD